MSSALPVGIKVADLRPTQMTVGYREVLAKRRQWRDADADARARLLRHHVLPAVVGPKHRLHIVDHHHFARALLEEDAGRVAVYILANLSDLPRDAFWTYLDNSGWCHSYDADGRRRKLSAIPKRLAGLADDPFRSLVGALIRAGGCAKSAKPYAEFLWADHLRRRIAASMLDDWDAAVARAVALARSPEARSLPGWCGPDPDGV